MLTKKLKESLHLLAPLELFRNEELSKLKGNVQLTALDVGARGGFDELITPIGPFVNFVGFDPDEEEICRLEGIASGNSTWKSVRYLPIALGVKSESRTLYLTRSPGCASLLPPSPEVYAAFGRENLFSVDREVAIKTIPLDDASKAYNFADASYLKIDIQGAELEVLQTGENLLRNSILTIRTEVEFQKIYKNQPVFRDVDEYLSGLGFHLVGFHSPISWARVSRNGGKFAPGQNCLGEVIHSDAIYFRNIEGFSCKDESGILQCVRAALLALAYGRTSYAAVLLEKREVEEFLAGKYRFDVKGFLLDAKQSMGKHLSMKRWASSIKAVSGR